MAALLHPSQINRPPPQRRTGTMKCYEIRVMRLNESPAAPKLETPELAFQYWQSVITTMPWYIPDREVCVVFTLNTRLRVTGHSLVSIGTLDESVAHCRDVFRTAVAMNAYGIVLAHSHPSGETSPSQADHTMTRRMAEASQILQITLIDHVIIGHNQWFSFKEAGSL